MTINHIPLNDIKFQRVSVNNAGMQLEIYSENDLVPYPLAAIIADEETEALYLEVFVENKLVQIPITKLQEAFELAKDEVHSERWYDRLKSNE